MIGFTIPLISKYLFLTDYFFTGLDGLACPGLDELPVPTLTGLLCPMRTIPSFSISVHILYLVFKINSNKSQRNSDYIVIAWHLYFFIFGHKICITYWNKCDAN